jgi:hypothetical protein
LRQALIAAMAEVCPEDGYDNPASWPRCALLKPHILATCETEMAETDECAALRVERASSYLHGREAYGEARRLQARS